MCVACLNGRDVFPQRALTDALLCDDGVHMRSTELSFWAIQREANFLSNIDMVGIS